MSRSVTSSVLRKPLLAEPFVITVPGEGWTITLDVPPLTTTMGEVKGKNFKFEGRTDDGFNLSVFVEQAKGKADSHEAVYNYYWPLAKRNPLIDQQSVQTAKGDKGVKVTYVCQAGNDTMPNVNYYFAFKGRWVDVHVSKLPVANGDERIFEAFGNGLSYQVVLPGQVINLPKR